MVAICAAASDRPRDKRVCREWRKERAVKNAGAWFESLQTSQPCLLRFFCFPYAGGSAQSFRGWQRHLAPEIDVCLVHLPGRTHRISEPSFTRLQQVVETIADLILPEAQGAFAFYGHSMGALISFELARELRRRNAATPVHLFLSGRRPPAVGRSERRIFDLPVEEFIAELHKLNGTPAGLFDDSESRDLFLPLLRADFEMVDTYEYRDEAPLACPIAIYGGLEDQRAPMETLPAWQLHTSSQCRVRILPGNHFFIHNQREEFIKVLRRDLLSVVSEKRTRSFDTQRTTVPL
jgi:medium-chain acyl-[acyl-carrier-protein] hydrolase